MCFGGRDSHIPEKMRAGREEKRNLTPTTEGTEGRDTYGNGR